MQQRATARQFAERHNLRIQGVKTKIGNKGVNNMANSESKTASRERRECAKLWAGLISEDEMDNQAGI